MSMTTNSGAGADASKPEALAGDTVAKKFWNACGQRGTTIALRQKDLGIWREVTWQAFGAHARRIAMALAAIGLQSGERASILSNTRKEWSYADFGILLAGGVSSGIYPTDAPGQVEYLMSDSDSRVVFVEDDEQLDKMLEVRARLPRLLKIVVFDMDGLTRLNDPHVISLEAFEALGAEHDTRNPGEFDRRLASRGPADLAILVYTSGTTGKPKGAMISHANLCTVMEHYTVELRQLPGDDKVAFLPLCHVAERVFGQMLSLETGARLNYVENPETIAENVREVAPTVMLAVPRIWEKFYSALQIRLHEAGALQQWAYRQAVAIGQRAADHLLNDQPVPTVLAWQFKLAKLLVLNNVRRMIGVHRLRAALTGAAPISPELIRWYWSIGVPMFEGWGMTETCAGGVINVPGTMKVGSIGKPMQLNQVKLSEQGEIMVKGPNVFMGYLNQPEKTAETLTADGWLRTGDVGTVDEQGFFKITDRMKDIIITAGGKNVTPSEFENELKFSPYITDAVVVGDRRPYLVCLIMIDHENVEKFAQDQQIPFSDFRSLCRARQVQDLIQAELDRANSKFARVEQIKKFRLIEQKLTPEDEELTPTMKLKRKLVNEKYKPLIEAMYQG